MFPKFFYMVKILDPTKQTLKTCHLSFLIETHSMHLYTE